MWNEEEIKNNILLPYLISCGFNASELSFETTFKIALGRGRYTINGKKSAEANGRLDILCKRDQEHLCVIELKAEGINLTDDDRVQGLTYARLLEPMAPYIIITNGKETCVYNTITGDKILGQPDSNSWSISGLQEDIELRYEALYQFIGMSLSNLLYFCQLHNTEEFSSFMAMDNELVEDYLQKKYIPSIYVKREGIETLFEKFTAQSNHCVFPIVGPSGTGKTNTILHLASIYSVEFPVLFYSGTLLTGSFFEKIKRDFNLFFSAEESDTGLIKKLARLVKKHNKSFIFFIDAVDEWDAQDKSHQLNELGKICNTLGIKLCVSCKNDMWDEFLSRRSIKTPFSKLLYPSEMLTDFNSNETEIAINKYTNCFKLNKSDGLLPYDLKNPFYLRVSCEISRFLNVPLIETASIKETFRSYLSQKTSLMTHSDECNRTLLSIAQILLEYGLPQISEFELLNKMNLPPTEKLETDLFAYNILYKYVDVDGRCMIGFYFSGIRDYLIAIKIMQLDRAYQNVRITRVKDYIGKNYICESAIIWFIRTGTSLEKSDVIQAVIEYDQEQNKSITAKLIRAVVESIPSELLSKFQDELINYVKYKFDIQRSNRLKCIELLDMVDCLHQNEKVETLLVDLFEKVIDGTDGAMLSSRVSKMLSKFDGLENTQRLLTLVKDHKNDDYVRRYIVEVLEKRSKFDKKETFKDLYADPGINVRSWVSRLYSQVEDEEMRNLVLELLDNKDINLAKSATKYLWHSKLDDTPKLLLNKLKVQTYHDYVLAWAFRCLAHLKYQEAIPTILELLKSTQSNELRDNLIISLGNLKAKEAIPSLMEILISLDQSSGSLSHWIEMSLVEIGGWSKTEMIQIAKSHQNIHASKVALNVLLNSDELTPIELIKNFLEDSSIDIIEKENLLTNWHQEKTEKMIDYIYSLANVNNTLAPLCTSILLNEDKNVERLAHFLKQSLPGLPTSINPRRVLWWNVDNIKSLAVYLRPWVHHELLKGNWSKPFIQSMLLLLPFIGDVTSLEILKTIQNELTTVIESEVIAEVEYCITSSELFVESLIDILLMVPNS